MTFEEYRAAVLTSLGASEDINVRYFEDYRKAALTALGVEYTDEDLRNEVKFRLKVLEGLGSNDDTVRYFEDYRKAVLDALDTEYIIDDLRNEDRFRIKILEGLEDIGLPDDYIKAAGLTMNNDCYYETDIYLKGSDTVKFSYSITGACNVFGCYTNTSAQDNYSLYAQAWSSARYLRYADGTYNSYTKFNTRYDVEITPTGTHGMDTDSVWEESEFEAAAKMLIGTTSVSASSAKLKGSIFGNFIVKDNNGVRFKGIPCIRKSDDVAGYYDTVSKTFYEPIGSNPTPI